MPRFRQITEITKLMGQKTQIRNLGVIAHIDHGKTTLTDSLLAGAGLLSSKIAGSARVLDYLEEEQKRGITIKNAYISILHRSEPDHFLVNLVDTPGHVDFTGKVARALRAIDGAIVVVDAVEGIMAQTETVTRQALEERVCPVLFINKVDRLINELKFSIEQIRGRFAYIIDRFNDLIEVYSEPQFKENWKVDTAKGNVAFGSALHKWGFTLDTLKFKKMKFGDIIATYNNSEYETLQKNIPLHSALLSMVTKCIPNPLEAQKYRVAQIWKGDISSEIGQAMVNCDDSGAAVMCVTNVEIDPLEGSIATGRLFSGALKKGDQVYLVNYGAEEIVQQVSILMGDFREPVERAVAGNMVSLSGLKLVKTGETITDSMNKQSIVPFERITYISDPVLKVAVEPKNLKDMQVMLETMAQLPIKDPNIAVEVNKETGEYMLSGMGELHLEIAVKLLSELSNGVSVTVSQPIVVYRESATRKGKVVVGKSPNKENRFVVQVEPLEESSLKTLEQDLNLQNDENLLDFDEQRKNLLVDCTENPAQTGSNATSINSGFRFACKAGPLCREPLRHIKVNLLEIQVSENATNRNPNEIMRGMGKAVIGAVLTANPVLLEPIYKTVISVPTELVGECVRILSTRRGHLIGFEQKGALSIITGNVPVSETLGLSGKLRSATSGRAIWQSSLNSWRRIPSKLMAKTITEIRKRKGLPLQVPTPKKILGADGYED